MPGHDHMVWVHNVKQPGRRSTTRSTAITSTSQRFAARIN